MSNIETLFYEVRCLLRPLTEALLSEDEDALQGFLDQFSWWPKEIPLSIFVDIKRKIPVIEGALDDDNLDDYQSYLKLFKDATQLVSEVQNLESAAHQLPDLGKKLFGELLSIYLRTYHPSWLACLKFFKVVHEESSLEALALELKNLKNLFSLKSLVESYGWDGKQDNEFDYVSVFSYLQEFAIGFGLPATQRPIPHQLSTLFFPNNASAWFQYRALQIPLWSMPQEGGYVGAGVWVVPIPGAESKIKGLAIVPYAKGDIGDGIEISVSNTMQLNITLKASADANVGMKLLAPDKVDFDASSSLIVDLKSELVQEKEGEKIVLLGQPGKSRFEYRKLAIPAGLKGQNRDWDFGLGITLSEAALVIQGGDGDGFIAEILPNDLKLDFNFGLGWSLNKGFYIDGGAGFDYTFQINKALGPVLIKTVHVNLHADENDLSLDTALTANVEIGPFQGSIQQVGLKTKMDFDKPGLLGNADVGFGFKPPSGVGLAIDAQGLKGGGFLYIEPPIYFGVLNVAYQSTFDLTIIGLIATELPGGAPGFSMVLSILAQFQPIQLGFGFALVGVGGLIGINRKMNEEGLREVYKSGSLDAILFPANPIKDATRILSSIQTVFPAEKNRHTFGLMALITWGVTIVKGKLGILIEVGGPGKIALIGQIQAILPNEKSGLVKLNMDILGFIDFGKQIIAIDARLYDSKILVFSVSGEMALRLNYSDSNSDFALAVGGFFPGFTPTIAFPVLKRARIQMDNDFAEIYLECYFAITTNSIQTGSRLFLKANWSGIFIKGNSGFDAMIQFSPFYFKTLFSIYLDVKVSRVSISSLRVQMTLTGPNPFRAVGYAKISVLFLEASVDFDAKFGEKDEEAPTEVSPFQLLVAEAQNAHNLRFLLPEWSTSDITFKKQNDRNTFLDPAGTLIFSQRATPLKLQMERFANAIPPENERYLDVRLDGGIASDNTDEIKSKFAPAQFFNWSDKEKLSAPPFELFVSGKAFNSGFAVSDKSERVETGFHTLKREKGRRDFTDDNAVSLDADSLALQGTRRLFKPGRPIVDKKNIKYVSVKEQLYTVTGADSHDGKFTRVAAVADGKNDLTYAEALQRAKKSGLKEATVRNKGFATNDSSPRNVPVAALDHVEELVEV